MDTRRRSRRFDRRKTVRRNQPAAALVRSNRLKGKKAENAYVQEVSSKGMRVTCGVPVAENDRLIVYIGAEKKPVTAQVIWVKKEGIIEKRLTGKPGQAFVAGCAYVEETHRKSKKKKAPVAPISISRRGAEISNRFIRMLLVGGVLGMVALCVHIALILISLLSSS